MSLKPSLIDKCLKAFLNLKYYYVFVSFTQVTQVIYYEHF